MRRLNNKKKNKTLFECGVGISQAAITPQGELKPCLMLDYPRYKILPDGLKQAWKRLKKFISKITPEQALPCRSCELEAFCKCCPAQSWLYDQTYTSCVPEFRKRAKQLKN